jgi:hypothetical protein
MTDGTALPPLLAEVARVTAEWRSDGPAYGPEWREAIRNARTEHDTQEIADAGGLPVDVVRQITQH